MRRKGVHMRHFFLSIVAMILSGCALPVPLQVAGWVLDGFSMVTTDKTLADHGLSMAAGQDCSIWRGITEGDVCVDERGNTLMTAMAGHRSPALTLVRPPVEVASLASPFGDPPIAAPYLMVH